MAHTAASGAPAQGEVPTRDQRLAAFVDATEERIKAERSDRGIDDPGTHTAGAGERGALLVGGCQLPAVAPTAR